MKKFAEPILPVHMGPKSCDTVPLRKGGGWGENWGGSRRVFCLLRCAVFVTQREEVKRNYLHSINHFRLLIEGIGGYDSHKKIIQKYPASF